MGKNMDRATPASNYFHPYDNKLYAAAASTSASASHATNNEYHYDYEDEDFEETALQSAVGEIHLSPQSTSDNSAGFAETPTPKRKRISGTTIVTKACEYCRSHHRKCDGTEPCTTCVEKGFQCIYTSRKRRGPKKGVQDEIKKELQNLRNQIETERRKAEQWRARFIEASKQINETQQQQQQLLMSQKQQQQLHANSPPSLSSSSFDSIEFAEINHIMDQSTKHFQRLASQLPLTLLGSNPKQEFHFYLSTLLSDFFSIYYRFVHPFHPLLPKSYPKHISGLLDILAFSTNGSSSASPPKASAFAEAQVEDAAESLDAASDMSLSRIAQHHEVDLFVLYAILANSCLKVGDKKHATEFIMQARLLAGRLFDAVDYGVGCGFGLMTYYYLCNNEPEKVGSYTSLIDNLCLSLNKIDSHLYAINWYFKAALGNYETQISSLEGLFNSHLKNTPAINADKILSICWRARLELEVLDETQLEDAPSAQPSSSSASTNCRKITSLERNKLLNHLLQQLQQASLFFDNQNNYFPPHIALIMQVHLWADLGMLYHRMGRKDLALEWGNKVVAVAANEPNFKYVCVMVLASSLPGIASTLIDINNLSGAGILLREMQYIAEYAGIMRPCYEKLKQKYNAMLLQQRQRRPQQVPTQNQQQLQQVLHGLDFPSLMEALTLLIPEQSLVYLENIETQSQNQLQAQREQFRQQEEMIKDLQHLFLQQQQQQQQLQHFRFQSGSTMPPPMGTGTGTGTGSGTQQMVFKQLNHNTQCMHAGAVIDYGTNNNISIINNSIINHNIDNSPWSAYRTTTTTSGSSSSSSYGAAASTSSSTNTDSVSSVNIEEIIKSVISQQQQQQQ